MKLRLFFKWLIVSCFTVGYLAGLFYFSKIIGRLMGIDYGMLFFMGLLISGICLLIVKVGSEKQKKSDSPLPSAKVGKDQFGRDFRDIPLS